MKKLLALTCAANLLCVSPVFATDLMRLSGSAANEGAAGMVGLAPNTQTALLANPALLSSVADGVDLSLAALRANSDFTSSIGEVATADKGPGVLPEIGIKGSLSDSSWSWGAGFVFQSAMQADFRFQDPPGTGGVSYGVQTHRSEWVIAKLAGALSYTFSDRLSAGLSLGLAYNRNQLEAPYIFQSHPVLTGLKVLVDLDADDLAVTAGLGLDYALSDTLRFNLAYNLETEFSADGDASGNLGQLGLGIQEDFHYQSRVDTAMPATLLAGLTWQASERLQLGLQLDRVFWGNAFGQLPIVLTEGSNADLNAFLGQDSIVDIAPLAWSDQDSVHVGGQYRLMDGSLLRFGYESSEAPVPRRTFTPMTGAILDEAYAVGLRFRLGRRDYDVAYRFSQGDDYYIANSGLAGGEYSNTSQSLKLHSLSLSFRL